jgi:hypothetical protein
MDEEEEFVLSFDGLPEHSNWTDIIKRVCKMLPMSNIEFLSISASDVLDRVNLVELFKRCTKVSALQAVGRGTSDLVRALTTPKITNTKTSPAGKGKQNKRDSRGSTSTPPQPARSTPTPAPEPLFPKLTFLSLKRLDFAENEHPSDTLFDVVESGLRQRKEANRAPLKMLRIEKCAISARRTKALQILVQKFHWDGTKSLVDEPEDFRVGESNDEDSDEPASRPWWEDFFDGTTKGEQVVVGATIRTGGK